jgi:hypothetical protein
MAIGQPSAPNRVSNIAVGDLLPDGRTSLVPEHQSRFKV